MADEVLFEVRGATAVVTMNRPQARNAVDGALAAGLRAAMERVAAEPAIRVAVLTGAGPAFCSGMDLKAFSTGQADGIVQPVGGFAGFVTFPRDKPVIGAVNGFALAGGCEIALACDFLVAAESASFGLPEPSRGLLAAAGGVFRLPRAMFPRRAMELILTAGRIDAAEAYRVGLVNHVVADEELLDRALAVAERIAANAPLAVAASLDLARRAVDLSEDELWRLSDAQAARVNASRDALEGATAFVEKRSPRWQGA